MMIKVKFFASMKHMVAAVLMAGMLLAPAAQATQSAPQGTQPTTGAEQAATGIMSRIASKAADSLSFVGRHKGKFIIAALLVAFAAALRSSVQEIRGNCGQCVSKFSHMIDNCLLPEDAIATGASCTQAAEYLDSQECFQAPAVRAQFDAKISEAMHAAKTDERFLSLIATRVGVWLVDVVGSNLPAWQMACPAAAH